MDFGLRVDGGKESDAADEERQNGREKIFWNTDTIDKTDRLHGLLNMRWYKNKSRNLPPPLHPSLTT